jgi:hypothetical protein
MLSPGWDLRMMGKMPPLKLFLLLRSLRITLPPSALLLLLLLLLLQVFLKLARD